MQKNKPDKPNPNIRYICLTILWIVIIGTLGFIMVSVMNTKTKIAFDCDLGEIKYGISNRTSCWMEGVAPEYCPLPTKFDCKIEIIASYKTIMDALE